MMLSRPEQFAGRIPFAPRRLVVQYMDGRALRYEDETFDFIYSSSSLEHFGTLAEISTSVQEMARVLRPGGILSISTEYRLSGHNEWLGSYTYLFDDRAIEEVIVKPSGCQPVDTPSFNISQVTRAGISDFRQACNELERALVPGANRLELIWSRYPHIVIAHGDLSWTSIHVCLQKPS
jgi:SAM-dependent methyltransferase